MSNELDQILISSSGAEWHEKLSAIHSTVRTATYFEPGDDRLQQLRDIIENVRQRKDQAVTEYALKFDEVTLTSEMFKVDAEEIKKAQKQVDSKLLKSIRQAIKNVRKYQKEIFIGKSDTKPGIKYTPIKRVGVCVPAASAPLPSTVIMTVVPAQVAGVKEIVVVSPPRYKGNIHPTILATCCELGITEVYRIGGVQAVAAMAFGTQYIKPVDKIVGPGNQWVQMAKKEVFGHVDIDSIAGPSEVLIIANEKANPVWVAADMLSQAEHAPGSAVVFTNSQETANKILEELKKQVEQLGRKDDTIKCLLKFGAIITFANNDEIITQANYFAAEHLEIQCGEESREISRQIENAGAIFIGDYSPVAVGDYWAGPSHTLPTGQSAKFFSALSANDFIKSTSIIEYDKEMLAKSAEDIIRLAEAEGLDAHARSVRIRQEK
jgi:histidinol dehydrogenase